MRRSELSEQGPADTVFFRDGVLYAIDQTALPGEMRIVPLATPDEVARAIRILAIRGAMAIGVAAAYGVLLGALKAEDESADDIKAGAVEAARIIGASRPTARNLFWALERMEGALEDGTADGPVALIERLHARADEVALETIETNRRLVEVGQEVIPEQTRAITHCNSGPLAALRYGTALGVLIEAHRLDKGIHVYACETRPLLQGARLTAWELQREGVPYTLLPDGAAAFVMKRGLAHLVITGADRIAANGDTANKIGTYSLAVLAKAHGIPFYIAAPRSTVDLCAEDGSSIVIEERDADEVRYCGGRLVAPEGAPVYNPAFDVTPASYISGIVTESGIIRPPYEEGLAGLCARE